MDGQGPRHNPLANPLGPIVAVLSTAWRLRWLLRLFLSREINNRYLGSISGSFWVFVQPLVQLAIYGFVFRVIFKVRFPELGDHGFLVFVAVALWPWLAFSEGLQRATAAVQGNADLIKKVNLPKELLVVAAVGAAYAVHLTGYLVVILLLFLLGNPIAPLALPLVLLLWGVQFVLTLGLGLMLAACQVFLRDLEHVVMPVLMMGFYATPILYPQTLVPESLQLAMNANPMAYFVERARDLLLNQHWMLGWPDALAFCISAVLCYLGWRFFRRCSHRFEDFL